MTDDDLMKQIFYTCKEQVETSTGPMLLEEAHYAVIFISMKEFIRTKMPLNHKAVYLQVFNQNPPQEFIDPKSIADFLDQINSMHSLPTLTEHQSKQVAALCGLIYHVTKK